MDSVYRPRPRHRAAFLLGWLALFCVLGQAVRGYAEPVYQEADVKAVLIARVISFIRWTNEEPPEQPARPLRLTVLGDPVIAARLSALSATLPRDQRKFQVLEIDHADRLRPTDVLFVGRRHGARLEAILASLGTSRTLTIADTPGAALRGVAINLFPDERRMRLEINPRALRQAGLTASYQLMNSARVVSPTGARP